MSDTGSSDLWYVKLANGDVHRVTLDQIDLAFQAGHIDGSTMVLGAGETEWSTLGQLAGLDEAPPAPVAQPVYRAQPPQPVYAPKPTYAAQPVVRAQPQPVRAAQPVQPAHAPYSNYSTPVTHSLRPMSIDLEDFDDAPFRRSSSKRWVVAAFGVAAAACAVGFVATRGRLGSLGIGSGGDTASFAAAAAMAAPPAVMATPPAPLPATPPAAKAPDPTTASAPAGADSPMNPKFTDRFTDAQRQKLLDGDKQRDQKTKSRQTAHAGGGTGHSSSKTKSMGFTTDGNKFDPLNSSL